MGWFGWSLTDGLASWHGAGVLSIEHQKLRYHYLLVYSTDVSAANSRV